LPAWAAAYQAEDVDESVRDYVAHLLQRISSESDQKNIVDRPDATQELPAGREAASSPQNQSRGDAATVRESQADQHTASSLDPGQLQSPGGPSVWKSPLEETERMQTLLWPSSGADAAGAAASTSPMLSAGFAPRSLPAERLANLAEMRELANLSAKAAIRSFEKTRAAKHAFDRLPLMMVGLACGLFLLYFAGTCGGQFMQTLLYAAVGFSFLAAAAAAGQAVLVLIRCLAVSPDVPSPLDNRSGTSAVSDRQ
jgi:hypothetical protein